MSKLKKVLFPVLIISLLLVLGFYRDFVFKSLNTLLHAWDAEVDYYIPPSLSFFENYEYDTIVNIKWLLTFIFSLAYLGIALLTVKFYFNKKRFIRITIVVYAGIIAISGIMILSGMITGNSDKMYEFARYFMGMAQSPLILMILFPVFKLTEKENTGEHQ
jgi:hypothetical protein